MPKALGLVETRGLVAAIEAADAMVKTSNVTLIGKEITKPGLVTIKIVGEVAAVKASVDAGAAAAKKVGTVLSTHVIPRPDSQMELLIPEIKDDEGKKEKHIEISRSQPVEKEERRIGSAETPPAVKLTEPEKKSKPEIKTIVEKTKPKEKPEPAVKKASEGETLFTDHLERLRKEALGIKPEKVPQKESGSDTDLENMNVHQLRKLARDTEGFPIQGREISKANRQQLLEHFRKLLK
jgi:microcompartment protein CcmL/EutN